jgi:hypothetical protein
MSRRDDNRPSVLPPGVTERREGYEGAGKVRWFVHSGDGCVGVFSTLDLPTDCDVCGTEFWPEDFE